jgi:hypothetical protein
VGLIICLFYKFQTPEVTFEYFRKDLQGLFFFRQDSCACLAKSHGPFSP